MTKDGIGLIEGIKCIINGTGERTQPVRRAEYELGKSLALLWRVVGSAAGLLLTWYLVGSS